MNEEQLKQHLHDLAENFDEILTSTAAVKGEPFAQAVSVAFEGVQLIELFGRMASMAQDQYKEYADQLEESGKQILSSVVAKACAELSETEFQEAMVMGHGMYKRRLDTMEAIKKQMRESGE